MPNGWTTPGPSVSAMSAYDRHQPRQHQAGREHQQRAGEWATRASRLRMYGHLMPGNEGEAGTVWPPTWSGRRRTPKWPKSRPDFPACFPMSPYRRSVEPKSRPSRGSSKPAGRGSPTVGWFDSIAAPWSGIRDDERDRTSSSRPECAKVTHRSKPLESVTPLVRGVARQARDGHPSHSRARADKDSLALVNADSLSERSVAARTTEKQRAAARSTASSATASV